MKVNFSKIVIKDIEGRDVQADFQRQLGNQLYMQGRDIEECELGKRIYFADGDVGLTLYLNIVGKVNAVYTGVLMVWEITLGT